MRITKVLLVSFVGKRAGNASRINAFGSREPIRAACSETSSNESKVSFRSSLSSLYLSERVACVRASAQ